MLLDYLADKVILLVLDNMEKLRQNDKFLADVLRRAPKVKLLATSRQRLGVAGEWLFELKGLSFATDLTEYASAMYPAVQLFVECARRLRPDFDPEREAISINRICQLVDGFPLGIELAAQWVTVLPSAEIAAKLERSIDMLTAHSEETSERHHSLRLVMDDSWASLTGDEQRLFRWLSIFRGGFDLVAAEQVSGESAARLAGLVNKSWLRREISSRYYIHELLRQYGAEQLTIHPDEETEVRKSHARYYSGFLKDYKNASAEIDPEVDNLRIAWEWHLTSQQIDSIAALAEDLWNYYQRKGWFQAAISMLDQASNLNDVPAIQRGRWHLWLGEANYQMGRIAQSEDYLARALTLLGERSPATPDEWAGTLSHHVFQQVLHRIWPSIFLGRKAHDRQRLLDASSALNRMGPIAYQSGDGLRSLTTAIWDLNLAELADSPSDLARSYTGCCITLGSVPIHPLAERYGQLALKTIQSESDLVSRAYTLEIVALYRSGLGRWAEAKAMLEESAALYDASALPRGQIESRSLLAKAHYYQGQFKKARNLHEEALVISEQQGDFTGEHWSLMGLVECALRLEQSPTEVLMNWLERINTIHTKIVIGRADMIRYFGVLAQAHLHRGGFDQAFEAAQAGLRMIRQKPFAGSWTMEGYAGVAETFLSLLEMNAANQYHAKQNELMVNTNEACQAMRAFSRIFSIAQPRAWLCLGWYDWIAGKDSNANRTWQKGLVLAGQLTMPYEQARAHYEIGRHLKNAVEGKFHLEKAHDIYTNLGVSAKVV
jgi:predicted ATPase